MVLRIEGVVAGRGGLLARPETDSRDGGISAAFTNAPRSLKQRFYDLLSWAHRGYSQANAGDLAAAIAYNALVALIPTFLLLVAIAGVVFHRDDVFTTTIYSSVWGLPRDQASDALEAVIQARRSSTWLGALSLAGFAWTGTGFVSCLARSMNRIYGVPGCGYMCEKRRGFFVILAFAALFILSLLASTVPTFFVAKDLNAYFERFKLAAGWYQVLGYLLAAVPTVALFGMLYRVVPNANQKIRDVWPGTLTAAALFVAMAQVFPIYLRLLGGVNRYGAVFGLISLLVAWFWVLAHLLLFGAYVNATHQHRRSIARQRARLQAA